MRDNESRGFVLTEALVALVIAAILGAALVAVVAQSQNRVSEASIRDLALRQARMLLIEPESPNEGSTSRLLRWSRMTSEVAGHMGLEKVEVRVAWKVGRRTGELELESYRVKSADPVPQPN